MSWDWNYYTPRLSVAEQRRRAEKEAAKLAKKKKEALQPVSIEGKKIANSFWGKAWCDNLESYSDYASRLPRGRSYVKNGCVIDLRIRECKIEAIVSGSELYEVSVEIDPVKASVWKDVKNECAGRIGSLIDLLQGKLSGTVMEIMTRRGGGLFPKPSEIEFDCTCPDSASMCKHIAATLYGVGARLDEHPELLFTLRSADQRELITEAAGSIAGPDGGAGSADVLAEGDLASVFGIELDAAAEVETSKVAESAPVKKPSIKSPTQGKKPARKPAKPQTARASAGTAKTRAAKGKTKPAKKQATVAKGGKLKRGS